LAQLVPSKTKVPIRITVMGTLVFVVVTRINHDLNRCGRSGNVWQVWQCLAGLEMSGRK